jgi:hypothetical protein
MNNKEEMLLRNFIRSKIAEQKKNFKVALTEERQLRNIIRKLLKEGREDTPHNSTGINVLEDLLNTIIPMMEPDYKSLTSDKNQRDSFRAHIVKAIQNLLSPIEVYFDEDAIDSPDVGAAEPSPAPAEAAPAPTEEVPLEEDATKKNLKEKVNLKVGDNKNPEFIPLEKDKKEAEAAQQDATPEAAEEKKAENSFQDLPGMDLTGRNIALSAFERIQKQILNAYSLLASKKDREIFYKYLITNVKLHFDKFEDELGSMPAEPTTPEYEKEKAKKASELTAQAPAPTPTT